MNFILPIGIGGIIYVILRTQTLVIFEWVRLMGLENEILFLRSTIINECINWPDWFIYSLPDGLWAYSIASSIALVWSINKFKEFYFWVILVIGITIIPEILQLFKIVPGTFDIIDLVLFICGISLGFLSPTIFNKLSIRKL